MHGKLTFVLSATLVVGSCGKSDSGDKGSAKPTGGSSASCVVEIQKAAGENDLIKVNGTGADEAAATADAWAKATEAAPEGEKDQLKDESKWKSKITMVTASMNDQVTMNANLSVTRVVAMHKGEATGSDTDAACADASKKACAAAGAGDDCVTSGAFKEMSVSGEGGLMMK